MEVSITGCDVGKMHEVLWCHVKNLDEPVCLRVDFEVKVRNSPHYLSVKLHILILSIGVILSYNLLL